MPEGPALDADAARTAVAPVAAVGWLAQLKKMLPGLALGVAIAFAATSIGRIPWFAAHALSPLAIAILLGIAIGNVLSARTLAALGAGVGFSKQTLLRAGIILYGMRLTLRDIGQVGIAGVAIDALVIISTFALSVTLGTRLFKLDRVTSMLIGAGSAICGAAAVLATEPVVRGRSEQVAVAIATVLVFGTLAIFLYPALYSLNLHWALLPAGPKAFGIYAGSTIHEVAQVFAAGRTIGVDTANTAVITKMVRVMMLAPFLVSLSALLARSPTVTQDTSTNDSSAPSPHMRVAVPWFAIGFIGMVLFNSLDLLPHSLVQVAVDVDTLLLAIAMAALGLATQLSSIRRAGLKPLLLAATLFVWLIAGGGLINRVIGVYAH